MITGSCLCGQVRYQCKGRIQDCAYCHCSICRKLTGSAFAAYGTSDRSDFSWTDGASMLSKVQPTPSTTRYFCSGCGSFLLSEHILDPNEVYISLGTLDGQQDLSILYHQFTGSQAPWYQISDWLPQYAEWPDDPKTEHA